MLIAKIFTLTVNDVCDRYGDQDDYPDNTFLVHNEFTTNTTTSATIYDITTTVVDDIKCTTDRSTIEENVIVNDVDHYDRSTAKQVHTTTAEFDSTTIDVESHTMSITADKSCTTTDFGTHNYRNMVPNIRACSLNDDFNTYYVRNIIPNRPNCVRDDNTCTTSATTYDITTAVVDDIKCTTDQSTLEDDVDDGVRHYDEYCEQDDYQDHIIIEYCNMCTTTSDTVIESNIKSHTTEDKEVRANTDNEWRRIGAE